MERTGERVLLREFADDDVDALLAVHADPQVMRYYDPEVGTREHARSLVTMFIDWANESPRRNFQLAIVESSTGRLVGSCGVRAKGCPPGEAEFGIGIGSAWWGRGIAYEAAKLVLDFGFFELGLQTIRGVTVAENEGVTRFVTRLGFTPGPPRQGDAWMVSHGWSARDWSMTREVWEADN